MVQKCSVRYCESKLMKENGIKFYRLPFHNPKLLEKWLKALKINNCSQSKCFKVCSNHFTEDNYIKSPSGVLLSDLLHDAVPSIFLDSAKHTTKFLSNKKKSNVEYVNSKQPGKKTHQTLSNTINKEHNQSVCFVPNCREPKGLPLYDFPVANVRLLHTWLKRIGLSTMYDMDLYFNLKICKSHFHENCFIENSMQLKLHAVPSINLIDYTGPSDDCYISPFYSDDHSMMTLTGDHTWGWLGSTEHFGRDSEPNEFKVIPKSQINDGKYACSSQAAHCMIYAENNDQIFGIYNARAAVLMQVRYDGYFGFPGGLIDNGEDFVKAVNREMAEEMNLDTTLHSVNNDDYIISHWSEKKNIALHFYKLKVTMTELIEIEKRALLAHDYGSEVLGTVRVPLYTLGDHYRGFPVFLKHKFIGCSRDQLLTAISSLNIMSPEEIQLALNAN